jgi:hypothetical protein
MSSDISHEDFLNSVLTLVEAGKPIQAIKYYRTVTDVGLRKAKSVIDRLRVIGAPKRKTPTIYVRKLNAHSYSVLSSEEQEPIGFACHVEGELIIHYTGSGRSLAVSCDDVVVL